MVTPSSADRNLFDTYITERRDVMAGLNKVRGNRVGNIVTPNRATMLGNTGLQGTCGFTYVILATGAIDYVNHPFCGAGNDTLNRDGFS